VYTVDAQIRAANGVNQTKHLVVETLADDTEDARMAAIAIARQYLKDQSSTIISIGVSDYTTVLAAQ